MRCGQIYLQLLNRNSQINLLLEMKLLMFKNDPLKEFMSSGEKKRSRPVQINTVKFRIKQKESGPKSIQGRYHKPAQRISQTIDMTQSQQPAPKKYDAYTQRRKSTSHHRRYSILPSSRQNDEVSDFSKGSKAYSKRFSSITGSPQRKVLQSQRTKKNSSAFQSIDLDTLIHQVSTKAPTDNSLMTESIESPFSPVFKRSKRSAEDSSNRNTVPSQFKEKAVPVRAEKKRISKEDLKQLQGLINSKRSPTLQSDLVQRTTESSPIYQGLSEKQALLLRDSKTTSKMSRSIVMNEEMMNSSSFETRELMNFSSLGISKDSKRDNSPKQMQLKLEGLKKFIKPMAVDAKD